MNARDLYERCAGEMEDYWGRRLHAPRFERRIEVFGRLVEVVSNDETALAALDVCTVRFSTAPVGESRQYAVQLIVSAAPADPGPVPEALSDLLHNVGEGTSVCIRAGNWGMASVDMAQRSAFLIVEPRLAARPDLLANCLLNTVLLNLFIGDGLAMLHASCLRRGEDTLLLLAPHNAGKSTTALRLVHGGYQLFTDSMVFAELCEQNVRLHGMPVARVKLRRDMVGAFAQLQPFLEAEQVRGETKYGVDLRAFNPGMVHTESIVPGRLEICLLQRREGAASGLAPARREEVEEAVMRNSLFFDTFKTWQGNLEVLQRLVEKARWHHLYIGADVDSIVETVDSLWQEA